MQTRAGPRHIELPPPPSLYVGMHAGALSAWLRLKHPEIVVGAVATSGPVQAVVDFSQYLEVVNNSLATSTAGMCPLMHPCNCACVCTVFTLCGL